MPAPRPRPPILRAGSGQPQCRRPSGGLIMKYQRLDHVRAHATVAEAQPPMTREQRLKRWADVLKRTGGHRLEALRWVEFYAEPERRRLRRDGSPIALAFADPVLREAGLAGD